MGKSRVWTWSLVLWLWVAGPAWGAPPGVEQPATAEAVLPPFDYDLYCNARGTLVGQDSGVLLTRRPEHLERVYEDSARGNPRARKLFWQLEETFQLAGQAVAYRMVQPQCLALPLPGCEVELGYRSRVLPGQGPGSDRLWLLFTRAFEEKAQELGVELEAVTASLDLMAGTHLARNAVRRVVAVEGRAAMAEGRAAAGEAQAAAERAQAAAGEAEAKGGTERLATRVTATVERMAQAEAEALQARWLEVEALEVGPRHPAAPRELERLRPVLEKPPPGTAVGDGLWKDYVAYWQRRFEELAGTRAIPPGQPKPRPPLVWERYRVVKGDFQRGVEFERGVSRAMQQEAALPPAERKLVPRDMNKPRVDSNVGVERQGSDTLRYPDQLVMDEASLKPGMQPRVEAFSNKSRDFRRMDLDGILKQVDADAREATDKYGGFLEIRRPGHPLFGRKIHVSRVYLVYDAKLAPPDRALKSMIDYASELGVTLVFF